MSSKRVNYGGKSNRATLEKHRLIEQILEEARTLTVADIATYLGIARNLVHYHIRKMAYARQLIMMFEPAANGQLRIRVVAMSQDFKQATESLAMAA